MCKLSVVIPVYKTPEKLLRNCIDSVLSQNSSTLSIELILVDDGCPETSGAVCDEYRKANLVSRDSNTVKVIHQQNAGPSAARNAGLKIATGEYLTFVDADDSLYPGIYSKAVKALSNNYTAKVLVFGFDRVVKNKVITHSVTAEKKFIPWGKAFDQIAADNFKCGGGYPWNKVFNMKELKLLHDNELPLFNEGLYAYEDKLWCLQVLKNSGDVILLPDIGYRYKNDADSTSNGAKATACRQSNVYTAFNLMEEFISENRPEALTGLRVHLFKIIFTDLIRTRGNNLAKDQMKQLLPKLSTSDFTRKKDKLAYITSKGLIK